MPWQDCCCRGRPPSVHRLAQGRPPARQFASVDGQGPCKTYQVGQHFFQQRRGVVTGEQQCTQNGQASDEVEFRQMR